MPEPNAPIIVDIYTDGACKGNPGPGGYGAILSCGEHRKELQGGRRKTTNNRMELLACVEALRTLNTACSVTIYSDSKYIVNAFSKGWAQRWRRNGWKRNKHDKAENADLWDEFLALSDQHHVTFEWVRGHSGHPENERCDELATGAAARSHLPPDTAYEAQVERSTDWFD
ncbi:MAG: ribonuclease HI [Lentisphaerae bacterium]|jgi:ribonuclease HI|nr:ribonuclease HI [Lentisphaerota bacterium]MBT4819891.1 ribonuclease HI [Lentisphaerota bacterium]MBT5608188.1 ribonuclease HI [Lentisphaerota bacterium]MBT7058923.1 ribonuclease HI [Lentisphaerota bacterium]MBT7842846.1 ribonuclease HI [Lentisphaerota bacterium]